MGSECKSVPMYEYACRCHCPHDPKCDACLRARMMAKSNTSNDDGLVTSERAREGLCT